MNDRDKRESEEQRRRYEDQKAREDKIAADISRLADASGQRLELQKKSTDVLTSLAGALIQLAEKKSN